MPIVAETPARKKSREELDRLALARHLLKLEPLGVLSREICPFSIPTEEEDPGMFGERQHKKWGILPPRLFFIPKYNTLVHCYGDDEFYVQNPEYVKGGISKECYVLDAFPRFLSNQYALESMLGDKTNAMPYPDPLALRARKPPAMTIAEQKAWSAACKQVVRDRVEGHEVRRKQRVRIVETGGKDGQTA